MANIRGLLGAIAELPGVINQGLLGPLPINPQLEQMIGPAQAQAHRNQASNDFAMSLLAGGRAPNTLPMAAQAAQQGFQGRIFDAFKQQEMARLNQAQQDELARQKRLVSDPSFANLSPGSQEQIIAGQLAPVDPSVQRKHDLELSMLEKRFDYDMRLQEKRDAGDMALAQLRNAGAGSMTPLQHAKAVQALRKEYEAQKSVANYEVVLPLLDSIRKSPDTGYGDLDMIYSVGKVLDPGSVVREGELQLTIKAGSPMQQLLGITRFSIEQGGRLTPKQRGQLEAMVAGRVDAYRPYYERDFNRYSEYARQLGVDPSDVVGSSVAGGIKSGDSGDGWVEVKPGVKVRRKQ